MELYVWKSNFGIPSINIECMQILLYAKIAKVPIEVIIGRNPYFSQGRKYPLLKHGDVILTDVTNILNYFREQSYGADFGLSSRNCSESYAFTNLVLLKLKPILEYVMWFDQKNCDELMAIWYIKTMPTPFNYIYSRQCRKYAKELIESLYPRAQNLDVIQAYMNNAAIECFSTLATRLGQKDYFYGSAPSSLDACVYSYLAPLVKIPFPSKEIPNLLHTWPELIEYVRRIDAKYFPELPGKDQVFSQHEFYKGVTGEEDVSTSVTTKILALSIVAAAMFGYAVSQKIINIDYLKNFAPIAFK